MTGPAGPPAPEPVAPSEEPRPGRPLVVQRLAQAYNAGLSRCIILTGNIYDLFPDQQQEGGPEFVALETLLRHTLSAARYRRRGGQERFILLSLRSDGLHFADPEDAVLLDGLAAQLRQAEPAGERRQLGESLRVVLDELRRERAASLAALLILGQLLRVVARLRRQGVAVRPLAILLDHADALFPAGDMARLSPLDREALAWAADLLRDEEVWADPETAEQRPDCLLLLSPTATELNRRLLELPRTTHIPIGLPDEQVRRLFIEQRLRRFPATLAYPGRADPVEEVVQDSMGLTLRALDDLLISAHRTGLPVDRSAVVQGVNQQLQTRLGDIIKVVHPDHSMADVVGFSKLKKRLAQLQRRMDNPARAPAGITVVGPNGAGKTFIFEAFAAETGRVVVTLSQIRSEWFGKTDVFAELLESTLSAFGRILVLIDEAHAAFGSIHDRQTHETEARLTRSIIQMMDDGSARSRIFWVLITTRPDLLDPDVVRRGRCSLFVPIFDPEGEDAEAFLQWMLQRCERAGLRLSEPDLQLLRERSRGFSAGDYREFIDDFIDEQEFDPAATVAGFLERWTPSTVALADEREHQINLAVLRCDWEELLPQRFLTVPRSAIQAETERLRRQLGL